tara:strand:- start:501 stop:860 length:360 start_codon:yes stop_codon:yes gene_type:complete
MKVNNVEVIAFYPLVLPPKRNHFLYGSLHIYLPELDVDLRGVIIFSNGKTTTVIMPFKPYFEHGSAIKKSFPIFSFSNREHYADLKKLIAEEAKNYLLENINEVLAEFIKINAKKKSSK